MTQKSYVPNNNLNIYTPKWVKHLKRNQTKYVQEFWTENYKTFFEKKIKEDTEIKVNTEIHELEDNNIKMSVFPELIYRFNKAPIKNRAGLCICVCKPMIWFRNVHKNAERQK